MLGKTRSALWFWRWRAAGVPVAAEVCVAINALLDLILVRKIKAASDGELAEIEGRRQRYLRSRKHLEHRDRD